MKMLVGLVVSSLAAFGGRSLGPVTAPLQDTATAAQCTVDLSLVGTMRDILSNALMHELGFRETRVRSTLDELRPKCHDSAELLARTALAFEVDRAELAAAVERMRHVNCTHPGGGEAPGASGDSSAPDATHDAEALPADERSVAFAADVLVHVILHETAHALVREFDLPVLANEETLADAFATWYLVERLPDRAPAVLEARVASLLYEASEVPRADWTVAGEHGSDARRAHQIAALAYASDRQKYTALADLAGMSEGDRRSAADYGTEILRSWRRVTAPLWMPEGQRPFEFALRDGQAGAAAVRAAWERALPDVLPTLRRVDWHSQVKLAFDGGAGGAGWSRSKRTITVGGGYVARFLRQGAALAEGRSSAPETR